MKRAPILRASLLVALGLAFGPPPAGSAAVEEGWRVTLPELSLYALLEAKR